MKKLFCAVLFAVLCLAFSAVTALAAEFTVSANIPEAAAVVIVDESDELTTVRLDSYDNEHYTFLYWEIDGEQVEPDGEVFIDLTEELGVPALRILRDCSSVIAVFEVSEVTATVADELEPSEPEPSEPEQTVAETLEIQETSSEVPGDLDGDGFLTVMDLQIAAQISAGLIDLTPEHKSALGIDDATDAVTVLHVLWLAKQLSGGELCP
jgi:hypothetical protein